MIPQRGLPRNKTRSETQIDLGAYELNVGLILTAKRFSPKMARVKPWVTAVSGADLCPRVLAMIQHNPAQTSRQRRPYSPVTTEACQGISIFA